MCVQMCEEKAQTLPSFTCSLQSDLQHTADSCVVCSRDVTGCIFNGFIVESKGDAILRL